MNLDWLNNPVLGPDLVVQDLLIAGAIFLLGVVLSFILPKLLSRNIARIFTELEERSISKIGKSRKKASMERGHIEKRMDRTVAKPVRRGLILFYLALFSALALFSLDIDLSSTIRVFGRGYEAWRMLEFLITFILILILSLYALEPILRALIYASTGSKIPKSKKYRLYRSLRTPTKVTMMILGLLLALVISFNKHQLDPVRTIIDLAIFATILLFSFVIAQIVVTAMEPKFRTGEKSKRDTGKAVGRAIKIAFYVVGAIVALLFLGISPVTLVGGGVATGIVLGFGLQDTIANFAAGILIATDKPFVIGDRIRIDWGGRDTWGDVVDISLRSTWIKTPEEESIVIPNSVIASSQVWNYTRESPRMVLQFDVGISYSSDWRLAEKLIIEILHKHPLILHKPPPQVLMKEFGESAQVLNVWFWVPEARDLIVIRSDVMKRIKDAFDRNGVEIPYPYRTLVYKRDMPKPERLSGEYKSPIYLPSTGFRKVKLRQDSIVEVDRTGSVVLAPTSGEFPARYTAPVVMETAKKMGASVTAIFIKTPRGSTIEGQKALRIYNKLAKAYGVDVKLLFKEGDVLEMILEAVETENATIVVMGSTEETVFGRIAKRSVSQELLLHLSIPTMIVPFSDRIRDPMEMEAIMPQEGMQEFNRDQGDFSSLGSLDKLSPPEDDDMEE
ncbi:MAG: mechanosensitive ion channel [Candidatus Thermoplasmatota archaeon]|nr:mechanosensitive ion channel [Candidatus Thermoplasmatota archaeon]